MARQAEGGNAALRTIADATGQFANNFLKVVANENPGNLITSPLSAQVVLAMAAYGARGNTAAQMRSALLIPSDDELGQSGYQAMIQIFNTAEGAELRLANKIYTASQFEVKSAYKDLTTRKFLSASQEVDFNNSAATAATINSWCEEQTNNRIKDVIDPGKIDSDTKMVLVNAVYFKGNWEKKFDPHLTQNRPFHVDKRTTRSVPTMFIKKQFRYGHLPELNARLIEIPYQGNQFSMIIILPHEINGLKKVRDNLSGLDLKKSLQRTRPIEIELYLPKSRVESTMDLQEALEKMGMTDMFQNHANFTGIADTSLKVSEVIQKAFIEVNEEGSEAAAVTALTAVTCSLDFDEEPPPIFKVDHPYHYAIYHNNTGISLFTGFVEQPTYS